MQTNESWMQARVQKFIKRELGCKFASTNFGFQNIEFDVVGYELESRTFQIVECKKSAKAVEIGHAFGQLLAYKSVLHNNGYEFLNEFFKRAHAKVDLDDLIDSVAVRKLTAKFYVGLTEAACANVELLKVMKDSLPYVGIIRVKPNGTCRNYITISGERNYELCTSKVVYVPVRRTFNVASFLRAVETRVRDRLSDGNFADFKTHVVVNRPYGDYEKFWYHRSGFHFEVLVRKSYVEIALHLESTKKLNLSIYRYLKNNYRKIRRALGEEAKVARWGRQHWRRVYEHMQIDELSEDVAEQVATKLSRYIEALEPMVQDWERSL
jgi:hypothetical protein